jgi:hypothetical protein
MLKNHLTEIKGELCKHFSESILDMSKNSKGEVDFEAYYEDLNMYLKDVFEIKTLDDLDRFIEETDLWDWGYGLDYFYRRYCEEKLVTLERE